MTTTLLADEPTESAELAGLPTAEQWKREIRPYTRSSWSKASWQLINTLVPLAALWLAMAWVAPQSLLAATPIAALAGLFKVRAFILFHDCCHGSFLPSKRANELVGMATSLVVVTPFHHWRWEHAVHHATSGDLDRRERGDVWTMTVDEYESVSPRKRAGYRLTRHPLILGLVAPLYLFAFKNRQVAEGATPAIRRSVRWTNLALLAKAVLMSLWLGPLTYLVLETIAVAVGAAAGVWLFYVQHQFEDTYWDRNDAWDYTAAALRGSSYYALPRVLQWISGNIGFHHLHHLSPRIPNYELERCHRETRLSEGIAPLTLRASLRCLRLHLWDEQRRELVHVRDVEARRRDSA